MSHREAWTTSLFYSPSGRIRGSLVSAIGVTLLNGSIVIDLANLVGARSLVNTGDDGLGLVAVVVGLVGGLGLIAVAAVAVGGLGLVAIVVGSVCGLGLIADVAAAAVVCLDLVGGGDIGGAGVVAVVVGGLDGGLVAVSSVV